MLRRSASSLRQHQRPTTGGMAVAIAVTVGLLAGLFEVIPVASQAVTLHANAISASIDEADPWSSVWDNAPAQVVPLSTQNIAPPFGGGTVDTLTVRALHDGQRLFVLLEWADAEPSETVNSAHAFADAAAVQFPANTAGSVPPFTMGGASAPVNIWQWKALWQADIANGFSTMQTRYPNTAVDFYPEGTLYQPALHVGNPLSSRTHTSPVENLVAEGFGTLTTAEVQDVAGAGAWRDGTWRALFARDMQSVDDGLAEFAPGQSTSIAFAVWNGGDGDRNGQKSIAPWIDLDLGGVGTAAASSEDGGADGMLLLLLFGVIIAAAIGVYLYTVRRKQADAS